MDVGCLLYEWNPRQLSEDNSHLVLVLLPCVSVSLPLLSSVVLPSFFFLSLFLFHCCSPHLGIDSHNGGGSGLYCRQWGPQKCWPLCLGLGKMSHVYLPCLVSSVGPFPRSFPMGRFSSEFNWPLGKGTIFISFLFF